MLFGEDVGDLIVGRFDRLARLRLLRSTTSGGVFAAPKLPGGWWRSISAFCRAAISRSLAFAAAICGPPLISPPSPGTILTPDSGN